MTGIKQDFVGVLDRARLAVLVVILATPAAVHIIIYGRLRGRLVLFLRGSRLLGGCGRLLRGCGRLLRGCGRLLRGRSRLFRGRGRLLRGCGRLLRGRGRLFRGSRLLGGRLVLLLRGGGVVRRRSTFVAVCIQGICDGMGFLGALGHAEVTRRVQRIAEFTTDSLLVKAVGRGIHLHGHQTALLRLSELQQAHRLSLLDETSFLGTILLAGGDHSCSNSFLSGAMLCDTPVCLLTSATEHALAADNSACPAHAITLLLMLGDGDTSPGWQSPCAKHDDLMKLHSRDFGFGWGTGV